MSKEIKEYPFEKTFDVKFDESALKTFNDLIKEKGIRHFKLESDLYGILDVVSYEEYEKLQQKVEQLVLEIDRLNNIIDELEKDSIAFKKLNAWIVNRHEPDLFHKMEILDKLKELKDSDK